MRAGLIKPHADPHHLHALSWNWMFVPIFYGIAVILAVVNPYLSVVMYMLLLRYYALPGPSVIRWITGRRARRSGYHTHPAKR